MDKISIGALLSKNGDNYVINNFMLVNMFEDNMAEVLTGDDAGSLYPACYGPNKKYSNYILPDVTSYLLNTDEIDIGDGVFVFETIGSLFENCIGLEFQFDEDNKKFQVVNTIEEDIYPTDLVEEVAEEDEVENINAHEMKESIKEKVVAQDEAVNKLCNLVLYNQMIFSDSEDLKLAPYDKKTILVSGKTGTGRKEIIKQIADYLEVPLIKLDAFSFNDDSYSQRGAFGIYGDLLIKTNYNVEQAEHGIIVIDEINKILEQDDVRDIYKEFVQKNIVDFLDCNDRVQGAITEGDQMKEFDFDTSKVTTILIGDFDKIEKKKKCISGFGIEESKEASNYCSYLRNLGFNDSLVFRIGAHVKTKDLLPQDLEKITRESIISPLVLKKYFYSKKGIDLIFNDDFVTNIARKAYETGLGAKGIRVSFESACDKLEASFLDEDCEAVLVEQDKVRKIGAKK